MAQWDAQAMSTLRCKNEHFKNENDLRPDQCFNSVTEIISVCANMPENAYHMTAGHDAHACWYRQEADCLLCLVADC